MLLVHVYRKFYFIPFIALGITCKIQLGLFCVFSFEQYEWQLPFSKEHDSVDTHILDAYILAINLKTHGRELRSIDENFNCLP
jgi:hypothetical protein